MCASVKDLIEVSKSYLSDIQKRLGGIEEEIENGCERNYGKLYRELEKFEGEIEDIRRQIKDNVVQPKEKIKECLHMCDGVMEKIEDLYNEMSGDSNREILQMMFPNDDIDSEDFEGGLDIYNKD